MRVTMMKITMLDISEELLQPEPEPQPQEIEPP
jgi:hypothetical protein